MNTYKSYERLVEPARPTSELWRLASSIVLVVVIFLAANVAYFNFLRGTPDWHNLSRELENGSTARSVLWMLASFGGLFAALAIALRVMHRRPISSLFGGFPACVADFWLTLRLAMVLFGIVLILPSPADFAPERAMDFVPWLMLAPMSLAAILFQITTEELVFRGYLQSQLAARFSSPWVWIVLPSVLFAALHYDPSTYGENAILVAAWAGLFGLAAADLTARSGNLGPALALHFANNVSAIMFVSTKDYWDGLALYVVPFGPKDTEFVAAVLPLEGLVILCGWLVARIAIRR